MTRWIWVALAALAIAGCEPEPEGSVLRPPTESEAKAMEEKRQESVEFRPGVYQGSATAATGDVSIRAEFRADNEASITRNISGAKPVAEIMKGSYRVVDNIVEVSVTEVNGETTQFPLFFFEEVDGISTQDIAEGTTVRVFLERMSSSTSAPATKPPANTPAKPPATNNPSQTPPTTNTPAESPSNAPGNSVEPELPLASGVSAEPPRKSLNKGQITPWSGERSAPSQLRA
ncbi:MAG: hypothetical protein KF812_11040 [Fimbriimonadaceae bacterium]|nr:hypothetical protein [Fimbriimonadaceae bacterium]